MNRCLVRSSRYSCFLSNNGYVSMCTHYGVGLYHTTNLSSLDSDAFLEYFISSKKFFGQKETYAPKTKHIIPAHRCSDALKTACFVVGESTQDGLFLDTCLINIKGYDVPCIVGLSQYGTVAIASSEDKLFRLDSVPIPIPKKKEGFQIQSSTACFVVGESTQDGLFFDTCLINIKGYDVPCIVGLSQYGTVAIASSEDKLFRLDSVPIPIPKKKKVSRSKARSSSKSSPKKDDENEIDNEILFPPYTPVVTHISGYNEYLFLVCSNNVLYVLKPSIDSTLSVELIFYFILPAPLTAITPLKGPIPGLILFPLKLTKMGKRRRKGEPDESVPSEKHASFRAINLLDSSCPPSFSPRVVAIDWCKLDGKDCIAYCLPMGTIVIMDNKSRMFNLSFKKADATEQRTASEWLGMDRVKDMPAGVPLPLYLESLRESGEIVIGECEEGHSESVKNFQFFSPLFQPSSFPIFVDISVTAAGDVFALTESGIMIHTHVLTPSIVILHSILPNPFCLCICDGLVKEGQDKPSDRCFCKSGNVSKHMMRMNGDMVDVLKDIQSKHQDGSIGCKHSDVFDSFLPSFSVMSDHIGICILSPHPLLVTAVTLRISPVRDTLSKMECSTMGVWGYGGIGRGEQDGSEKSKEEEGEKDEEEEGDERFPKDMAIWKFPHFHVPSLLSRIRSLETCEYGRVMSMNVSSQEKEALDELLSYWFEKKLISEIAMKTAKRVFEVKKKDKKVVKYKKGTEFTDVEGVEDASHELWCIHCDEGWKEAKRCPTCNDSLVSYQTYLITEK
ncbi:hypothetical protein ADUPG1_007019 [Aduncisulcus paluster]|uniref:Uncharacterized protein n=1 Tax=Aduncisulcus paluster TaxID=2918883 RepID=A0ABQ5KKE6_9EUKA|nr:hypothetical protein ADUPG1_007019 [Aduncisulcus paluster]